MRSVVDRNVVMGRIPVLESRTDFHEFWYRRLVKHNRSVPDKLVGPEWIFDVNICLLLHAHHCRIGCKTASEKKSWREIKNSFYMFRFPALPDFLSSSGSGTGST